MLWFQILASYIKKYWSLILFFVGAIVGLLLFKKNQLDYVENLKKIQTDHELEIKKIKDAYDSERLERELNIKKLNETLEYLQSEYDKAKKDLDAKKKKQIEDLVKSYKNDPETLAKKLSEITGFVIVLPK